MPEITERVGETLGRKVGPLPLGGWAAIGIGTIVVVKLLKGGGSSGGGGGGSVTIPDAFTDDGSGIVGGSSGGGGGTTIPASSPPAGSGSTVAVKPLTVSISSKTRLYNAAHSLIGSVTKATYTVKKGGSHGGGWYWYQIVAPGSVNNGKWLIAKPDANGKLTVQA